MDSTKEVNRYDPEISNIKSEIIDQSDKKCSSENPDNRNLSINKQDSAYHSIDKPKSTDPSCIKPDISISYSHMSERNDNLHDYTGISNVNGKVNTPEMLSNIQNRLVFPSGKFGSYVNLCNNSQEPNAPMKNTGSCDISSDNPGSCYFSASNPDSCDFSASNPDSCDFSCDKSFSNTSQEPDAPMKNTGGCDTPSDNPGSCYFSTSNPDSCDFSCDQPLSNTSQEPDSPMKNTGGCDTPSDNPGSCYFSTSNPDSCDFSCDQPWSENFPRRKSRSSKFFSENIWGSNLTNDNPVTSDFSSDKTWNRYFSCGKSQTADFSSEKTLGEGFLTNNIETCDLSSGKHLSTKVSSGESETSNLKGAMLISLELLNENPGDSKHSSSLKIPDTSSGMPEPSSEVNISSYLLNGKSCSANDETKESKNTYMSFSELDYVEVSNICSENPDTLSKSFEGTKNFVIATSKIPSYLIETSGILGYDPSTCENEKETSNIRNPSCTNSKYPGYESWESFNNVNEVTIADDIWRIEKCPQSSNVCVLKRLDEDTQYKIKCIYFNKGTKLDELFKNRSHDELNVSQEEILECIYSIEEDQLNFIEDPISSSDQSVFLEDRMGTSTEMIDDHELVENTAKEQINLIVDKLLNDVFSAVGGNEQNFEATHLGIKTHEKDMITVDETEKVGICNDNTHLNKLGVNLENVNNYEIIGSHVQDISGYQSSTDPLNDSVSEATNPRNRLNKLSIQQKMLNCFKIVWNSIFSIVLGVFSSFFYKTKPLTSTGATTQTIPEAITNYEEFQSETNASNEPTTNFANTKTVPIESMKIKARITNFSTLFQHLSATVGTDMTAERAMTDINSQVVMDIYNGFHELRIVDYGSLDLMSKCIRGCIVTLQRTLTHSDPIVQKASVLLREKTHTLEDMRKLNEDLKDLTSDAEVHLHNIDRALTGLEDFTDDFIYYKNAISKELVEFLIEDFPEIFK